MGMPQACSYVIVIIEPLLKPILTQPHVRTLSYGDFAGYGAAAKNVDTGIEFAEASRLDTAAQHYAFDGIYIVYSIFRR